jgi:hypothetical protein
MMITTSPATAPTHGPDLESFLPAQRESPLRGLAGRLLAAPPRCPHGQHKLRRLTDGHGTTVQTRWGPLRVGRARGDCRRCKKWRFPADALLGLCPSRAPNPPACRKSPRARPAAPKQNARTWTRK